MKSFRDKYGNILPNSYQEPRQSENPTCFNVAYFFSKYLNEKFSYSCQLETRKLTAAKYFTNHNTWRTMELDNNPDFSIDEKMSALAFFNHDRNMWWIDKIPIFPSFNNSSFFSWLRPDVMAYTLIIKFPWMKPFLYWIVALKIEQSIYDFNRDAKGQSSGMQLAFIMLMGLGHTETVKRLENDIRLAMDIYYPEEDHPIRLVWGKNET